MDGVFLKHVVETPSGTTNDDERRKKRKISSDSEKQLQWELHRYRFKYLFNQSCSGFLRSVNRRLPTGAGVYTILLMLGMDQLAFTAAGEAIITPFMNAAGLEDGLSPLVRGVGLNLVANLLFPITGWLGDAWVGRHQMIHLSMWLQWCGFGVAALSFSLENFVPGNWGKYILLPCYIVINLGSAGFQSNAISFGADQILYKTSHELSSYFYMYYWMRNFGSVMLIFLVTCNNFNDSVRALTYCLIAVLAMTVNLSLNAALKRKFLINYEKINPLKTVIKVLYSCIVAKRPMHRSAFSYNPGASQPSRMDLTKKSNGGKFEEETVENVKTFFRLLLILLALGILLFVYDGMTAVADIQVRYIRRDVYNFTSGNSTCSFSNSFVWVFNIAGILILIPLINFGLFSFLREYTPTMLKKIGTGSFVITLSPLLLLVIVSVGNSRLAHVTDMDPPPAQGARSNVTHCMFGENETSHLPVPLLGLLVPYLLVATAEILVNVSSIEFFYAQSPHTMRGMMVGLFFFTWGVASALIELTISLFKTYVTVGPQWSLLPCDVWYYLILQAAAIIGFVMYVVVARKYKNRQRGEIKSERFYREYN